jgi:hypothetical protein
MKKPLAALTVLVLLAGVYLFLPSAASSAGPAARPTPTPAAPPPGAGRTAPQVFCSACANLVVQSITTDPVTPTIGVTATVQVVIANIGVGDVADGNNFFVDLYVNPAAPTDLVGRGDYSWSAQSWYVPSGGNRVLTTDYRFMDVNTYALFAQIDTDNSVVEANELDNVLGPVAIAVKSSAIFQQSTHQDFQYGLASNLDLSHPAGVVTAGYFQPAWQDAGVTTTSVYSPDTMINDVIGTYSGGRLLPTSVEQVRPSIVADSRENIYSVWQDARDGGAYNNRIYFSRSTDGGVTWSTPSISITADIPVTRVVNQLAPRIAFDNVTGQAAAVWQDNRDGHYDIYFSSYYSSSTDGGATWTWAWTPSVKVNDDAVDASANKLRPSLVISDGGYIYVAWQDQRNGNDDIYFSRTDNGGATWMKPNTMVTDDPETSMQANRSPSIGLGCVGDCGDWGFRAQPVIYVAWEDWRDPAHPEIYVADSRDGGASFGVDVPVASPAGQSYRVAPTMLAWPTTTVFTVEKTIPNTSIKYLAVETAIVDVIHVAWQEGQADNADVYYAYAWYSYNHDAMENETPPVLAYDLFFRPKIRVNGYFYDYDFAQPPEGKTRWPIEPTWQGEVAMTKAYNLDYCSTTTTFYHEGVYVSWSDGRGFDRDRRDLFVARIAHPTFESENIKSHVLVCNRNEALNDNAKLYNYRDDPAMWALTKPANVRQSNPSVFAVPVMGEVTRTVVALADDQITVVTTTITTTRALDQERMFVMAWDDDRWDTPLKPGTRRNRDIFFARRNVTGYGVYISPVFDTLSGPATWYSLDWFGTTDHSTSTYFQTRTGATPTPPKENAAINSWTVFTGTQPIKMKWGPTDPIYVNDAPGQPIISPPGRFIQYKLIIDGYSNATAVTRVTIHYETKIIPAAFLPMVMSNYTEATRR